MSRLVRTGSLFVLALVAAAATYAADMTVGGFYVRLAEAKELPAGTPVASEASLRGAGYKLPPLALGKVLTEGDVASISTALGLKVATSSPDAVVTDRQVDAYVSAYLDRGKTGSEPTITGDGTGGIDPGNSGNGKGKKKGHNKSSSEPI